MEGCERQGRITRGYCHTHYEALRRSGKLLRVRIADPVERLWNYIDKGDYCWEWTGAKSTGGYGRIHWNGRGQQAHRVVYELERGSIPEGLELDHLCRNRSCVRPDHLDPVTTKVNLMRGKTLTAKYASRDRCSSGHLYTEDNVYWWRGTRCCRACRAQVTANRDRTRPPRSVVQSSCIMCGTEFQFERGPGGRARTTCSDACRKDRARKAAREHQSRKRAASQRAVVQADCVACGKTFEFERAPGQSPNTCSDECRKVRQRVAVREYRQRQGAAKSST